MSQKAPSKMFDRVLNRPLNTNLWWGLTEKSVEEKFILLSFFLNDCMK